MNLFGGPQPCFDHDHLLVQGDDRGIALLPHRDGCCHPAVVEGNALHLDLLGAEGLVDDLLVLVDDGAHAHPAGQPLALADDRPLLDQGNGLAVLVVIEAVSQLHYLCPVVASTSNGVDLIWFLRTAQDSFPATYQEICSQSPASV